MTGLLSLAFKVSRLKFWIYTGGTYVVGFALGMSGWEDFLSLEYMVYLLYFFFPANVFIYGVNDLWDEETDSANPKKDERETRAVELGRSNLRKVVLGVTVLSLILMATQMDLDLMLIFGSFLLLSYFYSARPLRFKAIPFVDFLSNVLYIVPGIFGYYLVAGTMPPLAIILAGVMHVSAMHLFSAIPDIRYDEEAGIRTTAVVLRKRASLELCAVLWSTLALLVIYLADLHPLSFLTLIYPAIPMVLLIRQRMSIERVYWYLPWVNTFLGGLLFTMLVLTKSNLI
jgi:4-hydroxybenzoate polyprenyltransferase